MPAHTIFCSHCGSAQTLAVAAEPFVLHCPICHGITLGLGRDWENRDVALQFPIPPVVSYQENEFTCGECEAALSVELTVRSATPACGRCAQLEGWTASLPLQSTSTLSREELAFLGQT